MGWELVLDRLPEGASLEDIPETYRADGNFFNNFFYSFYERSRYALDETQQEEYFADLVMGDTVGTEELHRRFRRFNEGVRRMCYTGNLWAKEEEWEELLAFENGIIPEGTRSDAIGLGLVTPSRWFEGDIIELITQEVWDVMHDPFNDRKFAETKYWSGLFKLLKYVFRYKVVIPQNRVRNPLWSANLYINKGVEHSVIIDGIRESNYGWPAPITETPSSFINGAIEDSRNAEPRDNGDNNEYLHYTYARYTDETRPESPLQTGDTFEQNKDIDAQFVFRESKEFYYWAPSPVELKIMYNREKGNYTYDGKGSVQSNTSQGASGGPTVNYQTIVETADEPIPYTYSWERDIVQYGFDVEDGDDYDPPFAGGPERNNESESFIPDEDTVERDQADARMVEATQDEETGNWNIDTSFVVDIRDNMPMTYEECYYTTNPYDFGSFSPNWSHVQQWARMAYRVNYGIMRLIQEDLLIPIPEDEEESEAMA